MLGAHTATQRHSEIDTARNLHHVGQCRDLIGDVGTQARGTWVSPGKPSAEIDKW